MSPGVYTREVDYSNYVSDTSTCVIGIVGAATRGPVGIPTLITTQAQMIDVFGEPVEGEFGVYSALQVLTQCNQVYYTRVVRAGVRASAGTLGVDKLLFESKDYGPDLNGYRIILTAPDASTGEFNVTLKGSTGDSAIEEFGPVVLTSSSPNYIETIINGQSNYIRVKVQYSGSVSAKTLTLGGTEETRGKGSGSYATAGKDGSGADATALYFRSKYYDSDLNGCNAVISAPDQFGYFDVTISDGADLVESWTSLSTDPTSNRYVENIINSGSDRIIVTVNKSKIPAGGSVVEVTEETLTFSGGDNAIVGITTTDIIGESTGSGLYAYSNPEVISIDVLIAPGWSDISVIRAGLSLCEKRADCIFIADCPFGMSAQEMIAWSNGVDPYQQTGFNGFDSSYGALYWPWLRVSDSYTKRDIWLPPSGFVAAQYAYTDEVSFPWNAPAGLNRGKITTALGVEISPTQGERDAVYGNRNIVNPIVNFISNGIVIWGQKTMQRLPSALDRVNVRRLMNYLKRNIGIATRNFVFEQNVESTWERWKNTVEPILDNARANSGIYDYKIVMEATASDIENSRMPISIYVKPTKAAEFISLTFNIMQYSASFDDIAGN